MKTLTIILALLLIACRPTWQRSNKPYEIKCLVRYEKRIVYDTIQVVDTCYFCKLRDKAFRTSQPYLDSKEVRIRNTKHPQP